MSQQTQTQPPMPPLIFRLMNPVIRFFVRRNIGPMGQALMVITHTGRKSGKQYSTPIGYAREGEVFYAFNLGGGSQWYKNIQANPEVTLTVKGVPRRARASLVTDPDDVARLLDVYKKTQAGRYERFFGVPLAMPSAEAARSPLLRAVYVRFDPA